MRPCRLLLVVLLLAAPKPTAAAQVTLSASTLTATIAEPVELRLIVRSLETIDEIRVAVPAGDYEIVRRQSLPMIRTSEWRTFEQIVTIAFFKTGDFTVGPLDIELLSARTVREKEQSATVAIKIRSVLAENDKDIRPLKKLLPLQGNPVHLLKYIFAVVLLLLLAALLLILKRKGSKTKPERAAVLPAPEIELEQGVKELWQRKLPQKGQCKLFFILLGEIVKHFLEREYHFNADDLTSSEIMALLHGAEKDGAIVAGMEDIFRQADLVKFAEHVPEPTQLHALADQIATLIGQYKNKRSPENEAVNVQTGR